MSEVTEPESVEPPTNPKRLRHWLTIGGVAALLGFMFVASVLGRPQVGQLTNASEGDLVVLLDSLSQRLSRLQAEQLDLNNARSEILTGSGKEALARTRGQLFAMQVANGTAPVKGQGVIVNIWQGSQKLGYDVLLSLVQELRDAGAEAIEIDGYRVGARTAFGQTFHNRLLIDNHAIKFPIEVRAIGASQTLQVALKIPGGVGDTVTGNGGRFQVTAAQVEIASVVKQP